MAVAPVLAFFVADRRPAILVLFHAVKFVSCTLFYRWQHSLPL